MNVPIVSVRNLVKFFGNTIAVDNVSFDVEANEFFALLGPSGCGKTTLLRMIAGFANPSSGQILIDGQNMEDIPPNRRPVNMVFQSYAIFPHMSVERNVGYGLEVTGVAKPEIARRVNKALERVDLEQFGLRMPDQLSGGQRQRVALARALVKEPKVLLLDEPLSALDAKLREQMQLELASLQIDVGVTFIIVTHNQDEALSMADRIAVMRDGSIDQIDTPDALYENPHSRFVAGFIGKINLIKGEATNVKTDEVSVSTKTLGTVSIPSSNISKGKVYLAVRPEKISISKIQGKKKGQIETGGSIVNWAYYGDSSYMIVISESGQRLGVALQNSSRGSVGALDIGDRVYLSWSPQDMLLFEK